MSFSSQNSLCSWITIVGGVEGHGEDKLEIPEGFGLIPSIFKNVYYRSTNMHEKTLSDPVDENQILKI